MTVLTTEDKKLLELCNIERRELREKIKEHKAEIKRVRHEMTAKIKGLKAEIRRLQDQANQLSNISLANKFELHPDYVAHLMKTFSVP